MVEVEATLKFTGPAEDVEMWLRRVVTPTGRLVTDVDDGDSSPVWTAELAEQLVSGISPEARRALRFMAEGAPEVTRAALFAHLGMNGIQVGGVLASFGFAVNRGLPRPYTQDNARRTYSVDPAVAPVLLAALDRNEQRNGRAA
jgi:hypothetical protein